MKLLVLRPVLGIQTHALEHEGKHIGADADLVVLATEANNDLPMFSERTRQKSLADFDQRTVFQR